MNPVKVDDEDDRTRTTALLHEKIDNPMHTTRSKEKLPNYCMAAEETMFIITTRIEGLFIEEFHRVIAYCTQAEVQKHAEQFLVNMLHLRRRSACNNARTRFIWFPKMIGIAFSSNGVVDKVMSEHLEGW